MDRYNEKEVADVILRKRKLKLDLKTECKDYSSLCFYYLFEKVKYYIWVELEETSLSWNYVQVTYLDNFKNSIIKYLTESEITDKQIDSCIETIMEVKHGKDN